MQDKRSMMIPKIFPPGSVSCGAMLHGTPHARNARKTAEKQVGSKLRIQFIYHDKSNVILIKKIYWTCKINHKSCFTKFHFPKKQLPGFSRQTSSGCFVWNAFSNSNNFWVKTWYRANFRLFVLDSWQKLWLNSSSNHGSRKLFFHMNKKDFSSFTTFFSLFCSMF